MTRVFEDGSRNVRRSWVLVAVLGIAAVVSLVSGALLWTGFAVVACLIVLAPAVIARDPSVVPAWTLVALVAAPVVVPLVGEEVDWIVYVALAALALLVVVEIDAFSSAELTRSFAVVFVVLTTMSVASLWGIAQFFADAALGTTYLTGQTDLMWDLVDATVVGVGAGILFDLAFRQGSVDSPAAPSGGRP